MDFFQLPNISNNRRYIHLAYLSFFICLNIFSNSSNAAQCSHNPVSECALEVKLAAVNSRMQELSTKLQDLSSQLSNLSVQTSTSGSLIAIFAQIDSNLRPLETIGPTDYIGSAAVTITITNNSLSPIDISCDGHINMRGYTGITVTNSKNIKITNDQTAYNIVLSSNAVPQGEFKTVTKNINGVSSVGSTYSGTLWGASLGTEAGAPLDCKITFLNGINNSITHIFVPVPYD